MKSTLPPLPAAFWRNLVFLAAVAVTGCDMHVNVDGSGASIEGSGNATTETRSVPTFTKIQIDGSAEVEITIGPVQSVTLTVDDNLQPIIETKVDGDTLKIRSTQSYSTKLGLKIKIVAPALAGLSISGGADMHVSGLDAPAFSLQVSGAGNAVLAGKTDQLDVQVSGAGNIEARNLVAQQVKVDLSGVGHAVVFATQSLDATVSGVGAVEYGGSPPQVRQNVSGLGVVKPL